MENLLGLFSSIQPLSEGLARAIATSAKESFHPKRSHLLEEGQTCKRIYFIEEGFARAYYYKDGKEITSWFMNKGDLMISIYSFFAQLPSSEYIELLEDCKLFSITYTQLQHLYTTFPEFNLTGRILTEQYYIRSEERTLSLRMHSAKERYDLLMNHYPHILQKASLGQIASYLGITQETLSRIRRVK